MSKVCTTAQALSSTISYPLKHVIHSPHKKPQPVFRPQGERLLKAKSMTIAAGVRCVDGIVICADTEHTEGEGKYEKLKIFGHDDWLLVSGSGWSDYIRMAFDKLYERFLQNRAKNQRDARQAVEEVILSIYQENIASVFKVGEIGSPEISLIVGVRCLDGDVALIKTAHTSVTLSYAYEAVGIGSNVFNYWAKYFFKFQKSMEITAFFSVFILQEVKSAVPGCGGGTVVSYMPSDLSAPRSYTNFFPGGDPLAGFPQSAVNVLLDASALLNLQSSLAIFQNTAEGLKGLIKSHLEMRERAKLVFEEENRATPTPSLASTPPKKRKP